MNLTILTSDKKLGLVAGQPAQLLAKSGRTVLVRVEGKKSPVSLPIEAISFTSAAKKDGQP